MKLTLEITPEVWSRLEVAAQEDACTPTELAEHWLFIASRTEEEIEAIEDQIDIEKAEQVLARSDPAQRRTLDELRTSIAQRRQGHTPPTNGVHPIPESVLAA